MSLRGLIKRVIPKPLRASMRNGCLEACKLIDRQRLLGQLKALAGKRKIVYTITPHPGLRNVGDQAQAIAIHDWLAVEFPDLPVVEMDKKQVANHLDAVRPHVQPDDLIFLHSGGNMGDYGAFSESVRRSVIQTFPDNRIISLPQTIGWSDTPEGRNELATASRIYNAHPRLTIIARDPLSHSIAREHFTACEHHVCPDFVLYLDDTARSIVDSVPRSERAVLCLRRDQKSRLGPDERAQLARSIDLETVDHDTALPHQISRDMRWEVFTEVLELFASSQLVVTDRFHGCIFAVLARTPFIALPTVDHKVEAGYQWFESVQGVEFVDDIDLVAPLARELAVTEMTAVPNWAETYFNGLGRQLLAYGRKE